MIKKSIMKKYRDNERLMLHSMIWPPVALVLVLLGSVAWAIWDWGNLPSLVEAATAFAIVLLGGWAVILIRWWTDYAWDD